MVYSEGTSGAIRRDARNRIVLLYTVIAALLSGSAAVKADAVLDWNEIAVSTAIANGQDPFHQARTVAIVQLAVFEAVNSIKGDYRPYLGTVVAQHGASADAAAIEAAYRVLIAYFPGSAMALNTALASSMASIPDGDAKNKGIATGDEAAATMVAVRASDGSAPAQFKVPGPPIPGEWQATPSCPAAGGVFFQWQNMKPFGIGSVSDFLLSPPPALTSNAYAKTYNEVMTVGDINSTARPADRAEVATFYAESTPTLVFNEAARQVAVQQQRTLSENARALALINMAINDSLVAAFYNKYHYNFWRPETAIHAGATDGNPKTQADPNYAPLIVTPCFPSYPSNHGSGSGGGAEVLRRLYGEAGHAITITNPAAPGVVFHYTAFHQITDDISDARVYGGIHFRTDQVAGAVLGRAVGTAVYKNNLRPAHDE